MYFWNTKALAQELSANTLNKKHYKNYYLMTALLITLVYYYGMYSPYSELNIIGFEGVSTLTIIFIGIHCAYKANGGDEGQHFLERMTALSFPILVQNTTAGVAFGFLMVGLYFGLNLEGTAFDTWFEWSISLFTVILQILFFTRLRFYMKAVAIDRS
ncbi:hypothetical protein I2F27_09200 [Acinetobacter sp. B5B]|uniref:hypothetical protein n=1 Tax=Acinetobacter baretiae TaxID=2605383 RepID=UPI0018C2AAFB|nr:hypothetical protein [Acinetobacter baretiae]MBF7683496.1 hypothetical protein [Acinetobacter baretiae]MBF7684802.1 hypothetical protein [Acinetobacter baretiae]